MPSSKEKPHEGNVFFLSYESIISSYIDKYFIWKTIPNGDWWNMIRIKRIIAKVHLPIK
jgi:hypothetical protein